LCRQSMGGRMDTFAPLSRNRTRRGMSEQVSSWFGAIEGLEALHARLSRVVILNRPALRVIESQDGLKTLHYLDPPYVHSTRTAPDGYEFEMTDGEHEELLDTIRQCKGKVLLSGYANDMYDRVLASWNRKEFDVAVHSSSAETKRRAQELIWMNY